MRPLTRPPFDGTPDYTAFVSTWANANGFYCAFCEKALTTRGQLFHKTRGPLGPDDDLGGNDWPSLLPCCGECATSAGAPVPGTTYLWPDDPSRPTRVYQYTPVYPVPWRVVDGDDVVKEDTCGIVVVSVVPGLDLNTAAAALATLQLFSLNGWHTVETENGIIINLPLADYVAGEDLRPHARWSAYQSAVGAAQDILTVAPALRLFAGRRWVRGQMKLFGMLAKTTGFLSTCESAFRATLDSADTNLLPEVLSLLSQGPASSDPLNRKRTFEEIFGALTQGDDLDPKRQLTEAALREIFAF